MNTVSLIGENSAPAFLTSGMANSAGLFALFCKDIVQAVTSAILMFGGVIQTAAMDDTFLGGLVAQVTAHEHGIIQSLLNGDMNGILQIAAAMLLFVSTRRGTARLAGIVLVLGYIAARQAGIMQGDFAHQAAQFLTYLATVLESAAMRIA